MKACYVFPYVGLIDLCASMVKGMGPCLCIAHIYLDKIDIVFILYVHEYDIWSCVVFKCHVKGLFTSMCKFTHTNNDLVNRRTLRGVLKHTLKLKGD